MHYHNILINISDIEPLLSPIAQIYPYSPISFEPPKTPWTPLPSLELDHLEKEWDESGSDSSGYEVHFITELPHTPCSPASPVDPQFPLLYAPLFLETLEQNVPDDIDDVSFAEFLDPDSPQVFDASMVLNEESLKRHPSSPIRLPDVPVDLIDENREDWG